MSAPRPASRVGAAPIARGLPGIDLAVTKWTFAGTPAYADSPPRNAEAAGFDDPTTASQIPNGPPKPDQSSSPARWTATP